MGSNDEAKSSKSDKSSSPAPPDQTNNVHVYPDWGAMQAYYGPRVPFPPYYNPAMASGHAPPPYMWPPPQPMMPPYGAPYAAIYSHGGVYAHPGVPLGSHSHDNGVPPSPVTAAPLASETPMKSMGNTDEGLLKKLKGSDGLAVSIENGNAKPSNGGLKHSQSRSVETDGFSEGSVGNTGAMDQITRKRSREVTPVTGADGRKEASTTRAPPGDVTAATNKILAAVTPVDVPGKLVGPGLPPGMATPLEVRNCTNMKTKTGTTGAPQNGTVMKCEAPLQNERDVKRERRKQSNRESARRSRLRKQAETEELARKVDSLTAENISLKSELSRLAENSEKLKNENARLEGKLRQLGQAVGMIENDNIDDKRNQPLSTENLLSKVDKSASVDRGNDEEDERYKKESKSGAKLHQLLDRKPRAGAVVAS